MDKAIVIIDSSERSADLFYKTDFQVGDPVLYIELKGKKYLFLNALEVDRGKEQAKVDKVLNLRDYVKQSDRKKSIYTEAATNFLDENGIKDIIVSEDFPSLSYKMLSDSGFNIEIKKSPLFKEREIKNLDERDKVKEMMVAVDNALSTAIEILQNSKIEGKHIYYGKELVTSEFMKQIINIELLKQNAISHSIIIASGEQSVDPHNTGSGPLLANESIIFDIFPQSLNTRYFGDQTRTFIKGKPSKELKKLYQTVLDGQIMGCEMVEAGVDGFDIHSTILTYFENQGYRTGLIDGRMQGFFHGTGHGVGVEIHESPSVSNAIHNKLEAGNIVTIEPGLYYKGLGGVRIEDTIFVKKGGYENLAISPKFFEIP